MQIQVNNFSQSSPVGASGVKIVTSEAKAQQENGTNPASQEKDAASVTISRQGRNLLMQSYLNNPAERDNLTWSEEELFDSAKEQGATAEKSGNPSDSAGTVSGAQNGFEIAENGEAERARTVEEMLANAKPVEETQEERDRRMMSWVKERFDAINGSYEAVNTKETIEEKQRALEDLRRMKQFKESAKQQEEKEVREAAAQSAKQRAEVDKDSADLLVMLESLEEAEKKQDEIEGKKEEREESGTKREQQEPKDMKEILTGSGVQMANSAMRKEEIKEQSIRYMDESGMQKIKNAKEEYESFMWEHDVIMKALDEGELTAEEHHSMVEAYLGKAQGDAKLRAPGGLAEVEKNRVVGLAQRQNAREVRREAKGVSIMPEIQKIKGKLEDAASDSVLNGANQEFLEQAASDLQQRVRDKINDRNDITGNYEEKIEEKKEEEAKEVKDEEVREKQAKDQEGAKTVHQKLEQQEKVAQEKDAAPKGPESEEWYTQALEELDEFIESQGIYIRQ